MIKRKKSKFPLCVGDPVVVGVSNLLGEEESVVLRGVVVEVDDTRPCPYRVEWHRRNGRTTWFYPEELGYYLATKR